MTLALVCRDCGRAGRPHRMDCPRVEQQMRGVMEASGQAVTLGMTPERWAEALEPKPEIDDSDFDSLAEQEPPA